MCICVLPEVRAVAYMPGALPDPIGDIHGRSLLGRVAQKLASKIGGPNHINVRISHSASKA